MVASGVFHISLHGNESSPVLLTDRDVLSPPGLREYIGGPENVLCRVASESILRDPPRYNPVVFFGGHQLGKTLLTRGLAARRRHVNKSAKAIVISGADFARDYRHAIETDSLTDFRSKYRRVPLLAIDDLHQIGEKTTVQEEFLHTVDALLARGHRLIAALPQAPTECTNLISSLRSRLSAGLTVPLVPPGPDARRTILRRLASARRVELPDAVIEWLADGAAAGPFAVATVPEMDHFLRQLADSGRQHNRPIDVHLAQQVLSAQDGTPRTPLRAITRLVCRYFNLRTTDLKGPTRQQRIVRARGVAMLLARQLTSESLEQVGRHFGNRDHTTVLHACRKTESLIQNDPAIRQAVEHLTTQLGTL